MSLAAVPRSLPEPTVLGKRPSTKVEAAGLKRLKVGEGASDKVVSDQKKEEEKKEEVKQASGDAARRSDRNAGKVANYNIDDIIDASLNDDKGGKGSGCISVMLA